MLTFLLDLVRDSAFATMTWIDALDIGLLAWLIYRLLILIRGTRAMQSLIGLALLGAVYVASDVAGLATLHAVLDNLFVYIVLALLILFQEDIRRALARAGGTVFTRRATAADANLLEEVIRAVFELSRRKIGALIAIEREGSLESFAEGAHPLEARVTTELLQSVFHPSSPLHDGAVVISEGRVVAAGVFLPITLSKEVSRAFGTRHRAAIGLTEATDSIALVVSEERGTVALVEAGIVIPVADADDLRERLQERMGTAHKNKPPPVEARATRTGSDGRGDSASGAPGGAAHG
jgi:diadenylate cyclase